MKFNPTKFRELMLYIARAEEEDPTFGRVKLEKLLFYCDTEAYARFGDPIAGADYKKDKYGPTAFQSKEIKDELAFFGAASEEEDDAQGLPRFRLAVHRDPDTAVFSEQEIGLIDEIVAEYWRMTATEISKKSHREMGWRIARFGDVIPYESVFLAPEVEPETIEWARDLVGRNRAWVEAG